MLERWSGSMGKKPTSWATFLIEQLILNANEDGKIPPPKESSQPSKSESDRLNQVREYLRLLLGQRKRNGISIAEVAEILDLDQADLAQLRNSLKPKEGDNAVEKH